MRKQRLGILAGAAAGIIDVVPMILQNLTWDAHLSAFSLWVISGFLIATTHLNMNAILKGILIPFLVFIPSGFLIASKDPMAMIPITILTALLGSLLGYCINKYGR